MKILLQDFSCFYVKKLKNSSMSFYIILFITDEFLQLSARRSEGKLNMGVNVGTQTILRDESLTFIDKIAKTQCPVSINDFSEVEFIDNDDMPTVYSNKVSLNCISADDVPL